MLTIEPAGGLCNRLYALHSALCLARDTDQPLRVLWKVRPNFGHRLDRLFEIPDGVSQVLYRQRRARSGPRKVLEFLRWGEIFPVLVKDHSWQDVRRLAADGADFKNLFRGGGHIEALSLFYGRDRPFTPFVLVRPLRDRIDAAAPLYRSRIGIHIRRTDHRPAIDQSTTELFTNEIERILSRAPDQRFFLATDDPKEAEALDRAFPGRIAWRQARGYERADPRAIEDAVVELYCLSRTHRILGSYASTFSAAAGKLGGITVDYMQSNPEPPLVW